MWVSPAAGAAHLWIAACSLMLAWIAHHKEVRQKFTSRLGQLFDTHASMASAAGIACLLGGVEISEVLSQAKCGCVQRVRFPGREGCGWIGVCALAHLTYVLVDRYMHTNTHQPTIPHPPPCPA